MADTSTTATIIDSVDIVPKHQDKSVENTSSSSNSDWFKPIVASPILDNILTELKDQDTWTLFDFEEPDKAGAKPKKLPKRLLNGVLVNSDATSSKGWAPFNKTVEDFNHSGAAGIGFCFTPEDPYVGIDVDGVFCEEDGTIVLVEGVKGDIAGEILEQFKGIGYIELSVSRGGYHIIVKGQWNGGWSKAPGHNFVECYKQDRYFTMSGDTIAGYTSDTISYAQKELDWFAERFPRKNATSSASESNRATFDEDIELDPEVLERCEKWLRDDDCGAYWRAFNKAPTQGLFRDEAWQEPFESASDLDWRVIQKVAWYLVLTLRVDDKTVGAYLLALYRRWPGYRDQDGERKIRYSIEKALTCAFDKREQERKAGTWDQKNAPLTAEQFEAHTQAQSNGGSLVDEAPIETPAPFRGAMTDIVAHILATSTKPQPELATLSAVIAMASCCPGTYFLRMGGMRLNLFGIGISKSGSGKDKPRVVAAAIVRGAGGRVLAKPASGQGLEDELTSKRPTLLEIDEAAHMFQELNGKDASSGTVALSRLILMLFSGSAGTYSTRAKATGRNNGLTSVRDLVNPMLNMLAFSTPAKLSEALSTANIEDGMLGRMLFAQGREGVIPRFLDHAEIPSSIKTAAERVRMAGAMPNAATGGLVYTSDTEITETAEARARLNALMVDASARGDATKDPLIETLLTRSFEKLYRMAGTLAVWDAPSKPVIELEHVVWANQYVLASDQTITRFCKGHLHGDLTQADAAKILDVLKSVIRGERRPSKKKDLELTRGMTTTRSFVLWATKLSKRRFDDATAHLVDTGTLVETSIERRDAISGRAFNVKLLSLDVED